MICSKKVQSDTLQNSKTEIENKNAINCGKKSIKMEIGF
jgi:hypothetical protein